MKTKSFFAASLLLFGAMVAVSGPTANAMIYNITANVINSKLIALTEAVK